MILDAIVSHVLFYQGHNSETLSYGLLEYSEAKKYKHVGYLLLTIADHPLFVWCMYEIIILLSTFF